MRIIKQIVRNININGVNYPVKIIYKTEKRYITYYFKKDFFQVSSPLRISEDYILKSLEKYAPKLLKTKQRQPFEGDDYIYFFGEKYNTLNSPINVDNQLIDFVSKAELKYYLEKIFYKKCVELVNYYKDLMNINQPYKIKCKYLKSKYGSNSRATYTLVFNYYLMHYDIEILKSVVVHELAHCIEFNHSKKFYEVVLKYYPNYRNINNKLKKGILK